MHGDIARRIRAHVASQYVQPARQAGTLEVEVRASDVHRALGLKSNFPTVCQALDSSDFLWDNKLALQSRHGPHRSSSVRWVFRLQAVPGAPRPADKAALDTSSQTPAAIPVVDAAPVTLSVPRQAAPVSPSAAGGGSVLPDLIRAFMHKVESC